MKRLGAPSDWEREYFTMDDRPLPSLVKEAFIRLYEQGPSSTAEAIHRQLDPASRLAVSDPRKVEHEEDRVW